METETKRITDDTPISFLTVGQFRRIFGVPTQKEVIKNEIPEMFGPKVAAEISGYSLATIYAKTSRNELPHFKRDNKVLIRKQEFFYWLTENRVETSKEFAINLDCKLRERVKTR